MLFFHDRSRLLGPVASVCAEALARVFGAGARQPSPLDRERAVRWLRETRSREEWIACDCRGAREGAMPLLSPRQAIGGQVTLVRHGRVEHAESCPFHRLRTAHETRSDAVAPIEGPFLALSDTPDAVVHDGPAKLCVADPREGSLATDRLARLLERLLHASAFDVVRAEQLTTTPRRGGRRARMVDVVAHYQQLDLVADQEVAGEIRLEDVWANHPAGLVGLAERLRRDRGRWPAGVRPQGFLAGVVSGVLDGPPRLVAETRDGRHLEVPVYRRLTVLGSDEGPHFVLGVLTERTDRARFEMLDAVAVPVASRGVLLPVRSSIERATANDALELLVYWRERHSVSAELRSAPWNSQRVHAGVALSVAVPGKGDVALTVSDGSPRRLQAERARAMPGVVDVVIVDPRDRDGAWRRQLTAAVLHAAHPRAA